MIIVMFGYSSFTVSAPAPRDLSIPILSILISLTTCFPVFTSVKGVCIRLSDTTEGLPEALSIALPNGITRS